MWRRELIIALGFAMAWPIAANGQSDVRALRSQILLMQAECERLRLTPVHSTTTIQISLFMQSSNAGALQVVLGAEFFCEVMHICRQADGLI